MARWTISIIFQQFVFKIFNVRFLKFLFALGRKILIIFSLRTDNNALFIFFQVSREEWFQLWEEYAKNPSNPSEWQEAYMSVTFQLFDASGKFIIIIVPRKYMKNNWNALLSKSLQDSLFTKEFDSNSQTESFVQIINNRSIQQKYSKLLYILPYSISENTVCYFCTRDTFYSSFFFFYKRKITLIAHLLSVFVTSCLQLLQIK